MGGFEAWSRDSAVYWTDYLILVVCLCCAATAVYWRVGDKNWKAPVQQFVAYAVLLGVAFALSGAAHQSIDDFYWAGHQPSSSWDTMDTDFKHLWLWSMVLFPLAAVAALGEGLAVANAEEWGIPAIWCLGAAAAVFQVVLVLGSQIEDSAVVSALFSFACMVGFFLVVWSTFWTGSGAKMGRWWVLVGMGVQLCGMLLVFANPHDESNRYGYDHQAEPGPNVQGVFRRRLQRSSAAPGPDSWNLTVVFHLCVVAGVCLVCKGVVEVDKYTYIKQQEYEYDVFQKDDRSCGGYGPARNYCSPA